MGWGVAPGPPAQRLLTCPAMHRMEKDQEMSILVGREAPGFISQAVLANGEVVDDFDLSKFIADKYAAVFFYPLDFTFVCPSEIIAFAHRTEVLACLLYTSPSPRDKRQSRMPSSA